MGQNKVNGYSSHKKFFFSGLFLLLIVVTLAILLTGCSRGNAQDELGTLDEGELIVYTTIGDDQVRDYLRAFNAEYPDIKVNYVNGGTGVISDRFFGEANNPQADVIWSLATTSMLIAEWQEMLQPYKPKNLANINPRFRDTAIPPNWVGMYVWMSAFCVNTELTEELELPIPQSWQDLADPIYKGHIIMPDPKATGTGFLVLSTIFQLYEERSGWEYLEQLDENISEYPKSLSSVCGGKYPIGISYALDVISKQQEDQRIQAIFPEEGSGWEMESSALVKKRPIKPAARTFLDWATSSEAMKIYAQDWAITAIKTDKPVPEGFPSEPAKQLVDTDFPWTAANRRRLLSEWVIITGDRKK
jgi:iron(III) transport system substrate-binding protein